MTTATTARSKTLLMLGLMLAAVASSVAASGCAPEQDPPSLIETTRVLGARVEVVGAPERATPKPGESVAITWLVTAPGEMPPLGWAFVVCPANGSSLDCGGEPLALMQGHDQPQMTLDVPPLEALGQARMLVLAGRVCAGSDPVLDAASGRPTCTTGGDGTTASLAIPLDLEVPGSEANHNPSIADGALALDGQPWPASAADAACADLPRLAPASKDHVMGLATQSADRESYTALAGDPPAPVARRERLQVSQFATAGKLARAYTWVEAEDPTDAPVADVKWNAPAAADVPAEGLVVHFTFVTRDGRGGVAWTARAACVGE